MPATELASAVEQAGHTAALPAPQLVVSSALAIAVVSAPVSSAG
jgi:hypothetical protein